MNHEEFVNLNRSGKRHHTGHFVVISAENGLGITRLGITVSKRIGNSVERNRIKRLVREFFRLNRRSFPHGLDIVITARAGAAELEFGRVRDELGALVLGNTFHALP